MAALLTQCADFTAEPIFMAKYKNTENKHTGGFAKVEGEKRKKPMACKIIFQRIFK